MKTRLSILVCLLALLACAAAGAATEQWRYSGVPYIIQIFADGSGGCAFAFTNVNNTSSVVWLDKNGATIHEGITSSHMLSPIIKCTAKELLYAAQGALVHVDRTGAASTITASSGLLLQDYLALLPMNATADKKGFFAVLFGFSGNKQALIRFSNK